MATSKIPQGFNTITPTLVLSGAADALTLYQNAFGAKEEYRMMCPDGSGKVMHACLVIGNSKLFVTDVNPQMGCANPSASGFYLYVDDVDSAAAKAKKAGLTEKSPVQDMFWGDRTGSFTDKFGIMWTLATHVRDVSDNDMKEAMKNMSNKAA